MKAFLKSIDYFSKEITFTYKGKDKFKTSLGGNLTLFLSMIMILNAWLIGKDIILKENPIVVTYEESLEIFPSIKINYKQNFFGFFISDTLNNPYDDETILKIIPIIYKNYYDLAGNMIYKEKFLEVVDCIEEFKIKNNSPPTIGSSFSYLKCIKNLDENLSGFWTNNHISYLMFKAFACNNKTITESSNLNDTDVISEIPDFFKEKVSNVSLKNCKSSEELNKKIPTLFFNFFYSDVVVNSKNHSNPINTVLKTDWYILGTSLFKTIDYYFQKIIVKTDDGFIFNQDYTEISKMKYERHLSDSRSLDEWDNNIFWLNIYISNNVKYNTREYIKIQGILAYLGGILQIIVISIKFIFSPYFKRKFNLKIINNLFDFALVNKDEKLTFFKRTGILKKENLFHENKSMNYPLKNITTGMKSGFFKMKNNNQLNSSLDEFKTNKSKENEFFNNNRDKNFTNMKPKFISPIQNENFSLSSNINFLNNKYSNFNEYGKNFKFIDKDNIEKNKNEFNDKSEKEILKINPIFKDKEKNLFFSSDHASTDGGKRNISKFPKKEDKINIMSSGNIKVSKNEYNLENHINSNLTKWNRMKELNTEKTKNYFEYFELDKKLKSILERKENKIKLKNYEIFLLNFKKIICISKNTNKLLSMYNNAEKNMKQYTDIISTLKISQDFKKLTYILFNSIQIQCFPLLSNPKYGYLSINHEIGDYSKAFINNDILVKSNSLYNILEYFRERIKNKRIDEYDEKILGIIDPKIKEMLEKF